MIQSLSHFQHEKLTNKKKKKFEDAQIAEKKVSDDGYANGRLFFLALGKEHIYQSLPKMNKFHLRGGRSEVKCQ